MTLRQLRKPTPDLIISYVRCFEEKGFSIADDTISKLFQAFPHNQNIEDVWLKVVTLNSIYNTNIYATYDVAKHVCELNIDAQLEQRSPEVVNQLASVNIRGKTRRNYSFASKYCSWHVPDVYPIYDGFVERLIWDYKNHDGFALFKRADTQDYPRYKEIIESFRNFYSLTQFDFKNLDKFLWLYGKEVFSG